MASYSTGPPGSMKPGWCVDESFRHRARWRNLAAPSSAEPFVLRLELGPVEDNAHYVAGQADILLEGAIEADLVLDTGATKTIISGHLARHLNLPMEDALIKVELAGGNYDYFVPATVSVTIGTSWRKIACLVPWPIDTSKQTQNILGMEGLLNRCMLCLTRDELHLFERRS